MNNDLLTRLQAAQSDEERSRLATEALLNTLSPDVQAAAWAAAVPHWFEADILAALLERSPTETQTLYTQLQELPFVEPFEARQGHNIHPATRAVMLDHLWQERREEYVTLSTQAANYFAGKEEAEWQIEQTYHLLISDPDRAADALWNLGAEWNNTFQYTLVFALAQAGLEHAEANRSRGRSRGWTYFRYGQAEYQFYRHQEALAAFHEALRSVEDDRQLEANCIKALGDVHVSLSEYPAARERYEEALPIYRTIGAKLGEANCIKALGDVHVSLSEYPAARERYEEALPIYRTIGDKLGEANCNFGLGDIAGGQKEWSLAEQSFQAALNVYYETGMQFNIALALWRLGAVAEGKGEPDRAIDFYREALQIFEAIGVKVAESVREDLARLENE